MNTLINRFISFTACIAILLSLSFTVIYATNSYAKGFGQTASDSDKKDDKIVNKSSSPQQSSGVRTSQPAPKPANSYTPPPSATYNRNDKPTNSGQRYSNPRNEPAPSNTYSSPSNNSRSRDTKINRENPYNYRQPGNSDTRTKTGVSDNTRLPNASNNRNNGTRSDGANNRTPTITNDNNTKNRYQQPDRNNNRDNQPRIDRNNNDISTDNRDATNSKSPYVNDIRMKDDSKRSSSANRQFNLRDLPSTRNLGQDFRIPNDPRKEYRKEYEDIGNIWRQRSERRDSHRDGNRRHGININIDFNPIFLGYCYDYRPLYSYPSVYCYYYDYFPPYIYGDRINYYDVFAHRVRYNEITIFLDYSDSFYVSDPSRRALNNALRDISQAWEQKDIDRFMMYVRPRSSIAIFNKGDYAYSLDWLDYSDMTRDAMNNIDTKSFEFERLTKRQRTGEITAYGRHKFYDWDGSLDTVYVRYTFEKVSGEWYITEAETSDHKNW
ncbi:MAG: hypothetical protein ACYC0V_19690 [Armatimonadota bacterium]